MLHHRCPLSGSASAGPAPCEDVTSRNLQLPWRLLCSSSTEGSLIRPYFFVLSAGLADIIF